MRTIRVQFTEQQWRAALNEAQKTIPLYDLPWTLREFTRIMAGVRS